MPRCKCSTCQSARLRFGALPRAPLVSRLPATTTDSTHSLKAAAQTRLRLKQARLCRSALRPPDPEVSVLRGCGRRASAAVWCCGLSRDCYSFALTRWEHCNRCNSINTHLSLRTTMMGIQNLNIPASAIIAAVYIPLSLRRNPSSALAQNLAKECQAVAGRFDQS